MAKQLDRYSTRPKYSGLVRGALAGNLRLLSVRVVALLFIVLMCGGGAFAYSVLTHEKIIDLRSLAGV